jgi:hypothetical protein
LIRRVPKAKGELGGAAHKSIHARSAAVLANRLRARRCHFVAALVLARIVMLVAGTLVPFIVTPPTNQVLLPSETATGLLPGGGGTELLDDFWPQPNIKRAVAITTAVTAFFIKLEIASP